MLVINERNVNGAYTSAAILMRTGVGEWEVRRSRSNVAGDTTYEWATPVTTVYNCPTECVLFSPIRDANPYFHLFEALWILAGRNDVKFLATILPRMKAFSDDGETFHGAYGERLSGQLTRAGHALLRDPDSRRAFVSIWDRKWDSPTKETLDLPCNTGVAFRVRKDRTALDATVFNRSNDVIWGCYGTNAVQFSFVLQFVAMSAGIPVGKLYQVSNSFHVYERTRPQLLDEPGSLVDPYAEDPAGEHYGAPGRVVPFPFGKRDDFLADLLLFFRRFDNPGMRAAFQAEYKSDFFGRLIEPMWDSFQWFSKWRATRGADSAAGNMALTALARIPSGNDWGTATRLWLNRRYVKGSKLEAAQ